MHRGAMWGVTGAVLVAACLAGLAGYHLYQRHLSSNLKRTLVAAMDPHCSIADVQQYLHAARPLVRTKRDAEVLAQTQKAFEMAVAAQQTMDEYRQYTLRNLNDTLQDATNKLEEYQGMSAAQVKEAIKEDEQIEKEKKQLSDEWDRDNDDAVKEQAEAGKLFNQVRAELGMPPLPQN